MIETKIVKQYLYVELGFPIQLYDVTAIKRDNEWHPVINVKEVAADALQLLSAPESTITGKQLAFIRICFQMDVKKFAELIKSKAEDIKSWEKQGHKILKINPEVESTLKNEIKNQIRLAAAKDSSNSNKLVAMKGMFGKPSKKRSQPSSDTTPTPPRKKPKAG
jgi:hypothetical protein